MPPNIGGSAFLIDGHGEGLSILPGDGVEADRLALQAQQKFPDEYRRIGERFSKPCVLLYATCVFAEMRSCKYNV